MRILCGFLGLVLATIFGIWITERYSSPLKQCSGQIYTFSDDGKIFVNDSDANIFQKENVLFLQGKKIRPVFSRTGYKNRVKIEAKMGDNVCLPKETNIELEVNLLNP